MAWVNTLPARRKQSGLHNRLRPFQVKGSRKATSSMCLLPPPPHRVRLPFLSKSFPGRDKSRRAGGAARGGRRAQRRGATQGPDGQLETPAGSSHLSLKSPRGHHCGTCAHRHAGHPGTPRSQRGLYKETEILKIRGEMPP